jgi:terminase large subunit-like protein
MSRQRPIIWRPNPGPQMEFLSCSAREAVYGGSLGGGKTDGLLMAAVAQTANALHRALILRRSFPQLRDAIERSHSLFVPLGAEYNKQTSQWRFPSGALIEFGFCDADEDKFRYLGRAFSFIGWDELTQWPNDSAYVFLLTRLRATEESNLRLEVRSTCCPGGPGHAWVKTRFSIPDDGSASECRDAATGFRRVFIPARVSDNPHLRGSEYERQLQALPEAQRKALLRGRWDVFEGSVFSEFEHARHTCEPFPIPAEWEIWRGAHDGFANPAAVLWLAHDEIYDRVYVIEELYQSGMTPEVFACEVLRTDRSLVLSDGSDTFCNDQPLGGVIDSASFADTGMGGGRADQMNKLGCRWRAAEKGAGSRLAGIAAIHARLAARKDGIARLIMFRNCRNLIRTLPAMVYSRTNPEDIDDSCEQHAVDALRYGLTRRKIEFRLMPVYGI